MTGFSKEMQDALKADAEKVSGMTGEEHTVEFFSTEDDMASYPPGITSADHIAHDMRLGRFPEQSTIAEFLKEAATESDSAILRRVMEAPTMEATETASLNATRIRNAIRAVQMPYLVPTLEEERAMRIGAEQRGARAREKLEKAQAETAALKFAVNEAMRILLAVRGHVEWICEHNERLNGGVRSDADRRDLEMIEAYLAGGLETYD